MGCFCEIPDAIVAEECGEATHDGRGIRCGADDTEIGIPERDSDVNHEPFDPVA